MRVMMNHISNAFSSHNSTSTPASNSTTASIHDVPKAEVSLDRTNENEASLDSASKTDSIVDENKPTPNEPDY